MTETVFDPAYFDPRGDSTLTNQALMQWGPMQFLIYPLNFHEYDHTTETDWARKEIAGAAVYREWTGEGDEVLHLRGRIFPFRLGGMTELEAMEAMRREGVASQMVRGDGYVLGWFVLEKLVRAHQRLGLDGIGQVINFEALFARVPTPSGADEFPVLWRIGVLGGAA